MEQIDSIFQEIRLKRLDGLNRPGHIPGVMHVGRKRPFYQKPFVRFAKFIFRIWVIPYSHSSLEKHILEGIDHESI